MKKLNYICALLLLSFAFLAGCGKDDAKAGDKTEKPSENASGEATGKPSEDKPGDAPAPASRDKYVAFLSGEASVTITDPDVDNFYNHVEDMSYAHAYTYSELLSLALAEELGCTFEAEYAFHDFGGDGTQELILRFINLDPSFMNHTYIIHDMGDDLLVSMSYSDGYRTLGVLLENDVFLIGGSFGAGAEGNDYYVLGKDGRSTFCYTVNHYFNTFAANIVYDLRPNDYSLMEKPYADSLVLSSIEFDEYVPAQNDGSGVKICVTGYSDDAALRKDEEHFVNDLAALGAKVVDEDEMNALISQLDASAKAIAFEKWEYPAAVVWASDYDYLYPEPAKTNFVMIDDTDTACRIAVKTDKIVTDVKILFLQPDADTSGKGVYTAYETLETADLHPDCPLVLQIEMRDTPAYGIACTDEDGKVHTYTVEEDAYTGYYILRENEIAF